MKPNGCHSQPRPTPETRITVQIGYWDPAPNGQQHTRTARYTEIPHVMSCDCRYSATTEDPRCGAFPDLGMPVCPHKKVTPT
jgi:hypothetical protein